MVNKNFVHYLPTGEIVAVTTEDEQYLQERLERGEPIIIVDMPVTLNEYKVDMATMTVVPKEGVTFPSFDSTQLEYKPPWQTN